MKPTTGAVRDELADDHLTLMRRVSVVLLLIGALYLVGHAQFAMDEDGRTLGRWCAAVLAATGILLTVLPLRNWLAIGSGLIAIAVTSLLLTEPDATGTVALFYLWPIISMAYFQRWQIVAGSIAWIAITLAPVLLIGAGQLDHVVYFGALTTVTVIGGLVTVMRRDELRLQHRLKLASQIDALTGLLNRRALAAAVPGRLDHALAAGIDVSVVILDIDHFKRFNDTYGHLAGDDALRRLSAILMGQARSEDLVCRFGGEEFAVVLAGAAPWGALRFIERVAEALHHEDVDPELRLTASWGIADATSTAPAEFETLLARADDALYAAKEAGRNRAAMWTADGIELQESLHDQVQTTDAGFARPHEYVERLIDKQRSAAAEDGVPANELDAEEIELPGVAAMVAIRDQVEQQHASPRAQLTRNELLRYTAMAMLFGGAFNSVLASVLTERPTVSQNWQWLTAVLMLVGGLVVTLLPGSLRVVRVVAIAATGVIALIVATVTPLGSTVLFFCWPIVVAAYFASGRFVARALVVAAAMLAVAVSLGPAVTLPVLTFTGTMANSVMAAAVVALMHRRAERLSAQLERLAEVDPLTGLLNRSGFAARLPDAVTPTPEIALLVVDADHFKRFNDTHGHLAGDEALRTIAAQLTAAAGEHDLVCRFGGEEFVIALPGAGVAEARDYADRVAAGLAVAATASDRRHAPVTVSGGIAISKPGDESIEALFGRADAALYAAKNAGRACTAWPAGDGGYLTNADVVRAA